MDKTKTKGTPPGVRSDVIEAGHRSECDKATSYSWGTESTEKSVPILVFRCSCGAAEKRVDAATGEILKEDLA